MTISAPGPIEYLDTAAATAVGRDYKRRLTQALDLAPGLTVADLGCGPGTDLPAIAAAVGGSGRVIGIDSDPAMVAEARLRLVDHANVEIVAGDLHNLPLADVTVDRIRIDRVLQHVAYPSAVLARARRVLRPGGVLGMVEPDWDTLAVSDEDTTTSRAFARFVGDRVRNQTIGRDLVRLANRAGLEIGRVEAIAVLFDDVVTADQILGLRRNAARAVQAGALDDRAVGAWLARLWEGPFVAAFTIYLVTAGC